MSLRGIAQKMDKNLFDLRRLAPDRGTGRIELFLNNDVREVTAIADDEVSSAKSNSLLHKFIYWHGKRSRFHLPAKFQHGSDDASGPLPAFFNGI
jgi:hypothetical protein